jgi:hypothetical protein
MIFARKPASDDGSSSLRCHGDKTATWPPERKNLGPAACLWRGDDGKKSRLSSKIALDEVISIVREAAPHD